MILLHAAPIRWGSIGGLHVSIPALVAAQNHLPGVRAALAVTVAQRQQPPQLGFPVFDGKIRVDRGGRLSLPAPFDRPDLVVFHSTYIPAQAALARRLHRNGIPYIICPRGGMTRYAQSFRRWKKRLGNLLFFDRMVARSQAVHCLTDGEAGATVGWNRPVFVVGNGIELPAESALAAPGYNAGLRLVFIGRLHVQYKGLDMLLEACGWLRAELIDAGASVQLYGPDDHGSATLLRRQIAGLGLRDVVTLAGPVTGGEKAAILQQADVFLHPSRSEGHPMSVLEALAHGLPCLLTPATNMAEEVAAAGAGWRVEASVDAVADGIRQVLSTDRSVLQQAGRNARRLAAANYGWDTIAAGSVRHYRQWTDRDTSGPMQVLGRHLTGEETPPGRTSQPFPIVREHAAQVEVQRT